MKRLWVALGILSILLIGSLVNGWYAQSLSSHMVKQLKQAHTLAHQEQWEQARTLTHQVYDSWNSHHFYLHTVIRHGDTDQILRSFYEVLEYLDLQEMDQYVAANADLMAQIQLLAEMEQASVVNVL